MGQNRLYRDIRLSLLRLTIDIISYAHGIGLNTYFKWGYLKSNCFVLFLDLNFLKPKAFLPFSVMCNQYSAFYKTLFHHGSHTEREITCDFLAIIQMCWPQDKIYPVLNSTLHHICNLMEVAFESGLFKIHWYLLILFNEVKNRADFKWK